MFPYPSITDAVPAFQNAATLLRSQNLGGDKVAHLAKDGWIVVGFAAGQTLGDPDLQPPDPAPKTATATPELTCNEVADQLEAFASAHESGNMMAMAIDWKAVLRTLGPIVLQLIMSL